MAVRSQLRPSEYDVAHALCGFGTHPVHSLGKADVTACEAAPQFGLALRKFEYTWSVCPVVADHPFGGCLAQPRGSARLEGTDYGGEILNFPAAQFRYCRIALRAPRIQLGDGRVHRFDGIPPRNCISHA